MKLIIHSTDNPDCLCFPDCSDYLNNPDALIALFPNSLIALIFPDGPDCHNSPDSPDSPDCPDCADCSCLSYYPYCADCPCLYDFLIALIAVVCS